MKGKKAKELLIKYQQGTCTEQEKAWLDTWYLQWKKNEPVTLTSKDLSRGERAMWKKLNPAKQVVSIFNWLSPIRLAAAVLLIIGTGLFFIEIKTTNNKQKNGQVAAIAPGGNKAVLTLADGTAVHLSSHQEAIIVAEGEIKYTDGTAVMNYDTPEKTQSTYKLHLSTPKGGQYQVILSDGTKVWLNAASTLKYPSAFTGNRREIELEGEAYFLVSNIQGAEAAKNPFIVKSHGQVITVLGTAFNLSTYPDDVRAVTTLVNGKIKVSVDNGLQLLSPGEETVLTTAGTLKKQKANVASAIAWKNGLFDFTGKNLEEVMRQLERWYNIEVIYEMPPSPTRKFFGDIYRNKPLEEVLEILKSAEIHFRIEPGHKLIITN